MNECMTFPDTVEEFMDSYKIVDTEQVYTNGTEMVPIYRMRQWFEHEPEIVRCKNCKWRNVYQFPPKYDERDYCDKHEKTVSADGFCSWAERRTDNANVIT